MLYREFGNTGVTVSALGFGGGHIGGGNLTDGEAERLLRQAAELGITLFDTARSYGASEQRIGRAFLRMRHQVILSTKIGYGIQGFYDWTPEIITEGVHQALRALRTDYIDIVHFHSCPPEVLQHNSIIEPLLRCRAEGKIRCAAYSGDHTALQYAVGLGVFDSFQASVNVCDQQAIPLAEQCRGKGRGFIAKRPLANAPWRHQAQPFGEYVEEYWLRWQKMGLTEFNPESGFPLQFTLSVPGVSSAIVGTANAAHLAELCAMAEQLPLDTNFFAELRARFLEKGADWVGQV